MQKIFLQGDMLNIGGKALMWTHEWFNELFWVKYKYK